MNWFDGTWEKLGKNFFVKALVIILALVAALTIVWILLGTAIAQADATGSWDPVTNWAAGSGCPPPPGEGGLIPPEVALVYRLKWGTTQGGPYPNVIDTDQTSATIANPFGPGGGTIYAVATAIALGAESCPSNEAAVVVDPFVPQAPDLTLTIEP